MTGTTRRGRGTPSSLSPLLMFWLLLACSCSGPTAIFVSPGNAQCMITSDPNPVSLDESAGAGVVVSQLQLLNAGQGDYIQLVAPSPGFAIDAMGRLILDRDGVIDAETGTNFPAFNITVRSGCADHTIVVNTRDVNEPPTAIRFNGTASPTTIAFREQSSQVYVLTVDDEDGAQGHAFSITGPDAASFTIVNENILAPAIPAVIDHESAPQQGYNITVTATDQPFTTLNGEASVSQLSISHTVTVLVENIEEGPRFSSASYSHSFTAPENTAFFIPAISASDDEGDSITFAVVRTTIDSYDPSVPAHFGVTDPPHQGSPSLPNIFLIDEEDPTGFVVQNTTIGVYNLTVWLQVEDNLGLTSMATLDLDMVALPREETTTSTFTLFTSTSTSTTTTTTTSTTTTTTTTAMANFSSTTNATIAASTATPLVTTAPTTVQKSWVDDGSASTLAAFVIILVIILAAILFFYSRRIKTAAIKHRRYAAVVKVVQRKRLARADTLDEGGQSMKARQSKKKLVRRLSRTGGLVPGFDVDLSPVDIGGLVAWLHKRDLEKLVGRTSSTGLSQPPDSFGNAKGGILSGSQENVEGLHTDVANALFTPNPLQDMPPTQRSSMMDNMVPLSYKLGGLFQPGLAGVAAVESSRFTEQDLLTFHAMCANLAKRSTAPEFANLLLSVVEDMDDAQAEAYSRAIFELFEERTHLDGRRFVTLLALCAQITSGNRLQFLFRVHDSVQSGRLSVKIVREIVHHLHSLLYLKTTTIHPPPATEEETMAATMANFAGKSAVTEAQFEDVIKEDEFLSKLLEIINDSSTTAAVAGLGSYQTAHAAIQPKSMPDSDGRERTSSVVRGSLSQRESAFFGE